ncbi:MAG: MATE family efflux transporter [Clostridia bacterium]|nr:MATE family efflux transporter [Clostridia bacterium]
MLHSRSRRNIDMTQGPLWRDTLLFALPLIFSGFLQLLFHAADTIVIGRFSGSQALAAVGSTGSLNSLLVSLFIGFSTGANVVVARFIGAKDHKKANTAAHTAVSISLIFGLFLAVFGFFLARPMLKLMDSPDDIIDLSVLYVRIIFLGMPFQMLYNFCSAILRAAGDTKRPLYFLTAAGVINFVLNLLFVIGFHMNVAGVALATIISQAVSAAMAFRSLTMRDDCVRIHIKKLKIDRRDFIEIARIGLPCGVQTSMFSIANVLIQSTRNSFGSVVIAGCATAMNLGNFISQVPNAFAQAVTSFAGQNIGAKKPRRILHSMIYCHVWNTAITLVMGLGGYIFGEKLLSLYNTDPEVVYWGLQQFRVVNVPYFLLGFQSIFSGALRGMGFSILPMIISLVGICLFRVLWVMTVFKATPTLLCLNISYPISWILTGIAAGITFAVFFKRVKKQFEASSLSGHSL